MVLVEVSPGELADKVSILKIKLENMTDEKKKENVRNELAVLSPHVTASIDELYTVNKVLWDVENEVRLCEKSEDFGPRFVRLARLVYVTNDRRAAIKREINRDSTIAEEKQYTEYADKKRPRIVVMTHMGLGDHIVCNGLIRHFAEKGYDVVTYVKHHYFKSVEYMYRDLGPTVTVVSTDGDQDAWNRSLTESNVIRTGIFCGPAWECTRPWCDAFYVNAGVDPKLLRDNFFMLRSRDREEDFYRRITAHIGADKYVVVHDDPSRYEKIHLETNLPIVHIGRGLFPIESDSLFDYCTLIERAQEYHGFDSSFAWIVELFRFRPKNKTFMHRYIRSYCSPGYEEFTQFEIISKGLAP